MQEFFRGWRRKLGVVTLVIACILAAGWGRSLSKGGTVTSRTSQFISHDGGILCEIVPTQFDFDFSCYSRDGRTMRNAYSHSSKVDTWHWRWLGFAFGTKDGTNKNKDGTTSHVTLVRFY